MSTATEEPKTEPKVTEEPKTPSSGDTDVSIPKVRFDEVNNRMKLAEQELEKLKSAQTKADEERLTAEKKFEELAAKRTTERDEQKARADGLESKLADYEARLQKVADARVKELPEKWQAKVPSGENVLAADRLSKIEELLELAKEVNVAPPPGNGPSPRPAGAPPAKTEAEARAAQSRLYSQF